jgi:hypothetical protein
MFSLFSLNSPQHKSARRRGRLLTLLFGLAAALLVLGCPNPSGGGGDPPAAKSSLIGVWASPTGDGYEVTQNSVIYRGFDSAIYGKFSFQGTIKNEPDFTATEGVLIVQYAPTDKPNPANIPGMQPPGGDFQAIYWRSLTANSVILANAANLTPGATIGPETTTLAEAKAKFTLADVGNYVGWSGVTPQSKKAADFFTRNSALGFLQAMWETPDNSNDFSTSFSVVINGTTFTLYDTYIDSGQAAFSGTIEEVTSPGSGTGFIFLKLTQVTSYASPLVSGSIAVGNWYAVHWRNKTNGDKQVDFAFADTNIAGSTAFADAKNAFQANSSDTYFDWAGYDYYVTFKKY